MRSLLTGVLRWLLEHLSDGLYVRAVHYLPVLKGRWPGVLHLRRPRSITEKLLHLKINIDRVIPDASRLSDKIAVREYVRERIGAEHLIPLLGTWERPEDIDWAELPSRFIVKTNHGAGFNVIVEDKAAIDTDALSSQLHEWLSIDYSRVSRENQYKRIAPLVFAEALLGSGSDVPDYKCWCFDGTVGFISLNTDRRTDHRRQLVDRDWNLLPIELEVPRPAVPLPRPEGIDLVISAAETLAAGLPFVRVDLYLLEGRVSFGELTFTPSGGTVPFTPPEWNRRLGDLLRLPGLDDR